MASKRTLTNSM